MAGADMIWEILIGLVVVLVGVGIITIVVTKMSFRKDHKTRNIYLGKMSNTDLSIQEAIKFIKLTNGINVNADGENENE